MSRIRVKPKGDKLHLLIPKLKPIRYPAPKPGRNQACPCLSGKKFKKCCKTVPVLIDRLNELIENGDERVDPDRKR